MLRSFDSFNCVHACISSTSRQFSDRLLSQRLWSGVWPVFWLGKTVSLSPCKGVWTSFIIVILYIRARRPALLSTRRFPSQICASLGFGNLLASLGSLHAASPVIVQGSVSVNTGNLFLESLWTDGGSWLSGKPNHLCLRRISLAQGLVEPSCITFRVYLGRLTAMVYRRQPPLCL